MSLSKFSTFVAAVSAAGLSANAAVIEGLDLRSNGAFGSTDFTAGAINVGPGDPTDIVVTIANQDIDADGTANDSVTFRVVYTATGNNQRLFNQGADTGFSSLTGLTVSLADVDGNTTDSGNAIVFDGFAGATVGAGIGGGNPIASSVDVNGSALALSFAGGGTFNFITEDIDFAAPSATVLFDNSVTAGGTIVARAFDLQFSAVPEPASLALLGLGGIALLGRRRA